MRRRAALMKDPTIREIWSQIKQFMDNKQWDDMMSYVNQLKEEDKKKIVDDKEFSDENHVDNNEFSDDTNENNDDSVSCVSSMTSLEYEDLTSSTTSSVYDVVHDDVVHDVEKTPFENKRKINIS